jgi:putative alpha-1,2-mannosidase
MAWQKLSLMSTRRAIRVASQRKVATLLDSLQCTTVEQVRPRVAFPNEEKTSLFHTGGSPSLGNFAFFPYASCAGGDVNGCVFPKKERKIRYKPESVKASPGYFGIQLQNGVAADMTTAHHTSLFRFKFPSTGDSSPLLLLDLTDLSDSRQDNATIQVDETTGRMSGSSRFNPSFGIGTYVAYFCADFKGASIRDNGIFVNSRANASVKDIKINRSINGYPLTGGGFIRFSENPADGILARIAVSYISSEQACSHAETEIPDFDFDAMRTTAESAWREKLSPITISSEGVDSSLVTNFYSGIYRTMVSYYYATGFLRAMLPILTDAL